MAKSILSYKNKSFLNDVWYTKISSHAAWFLYACARLLCWARAYTRARDVCARSLRYGSGGAAISLYKILLSASPYVNKDFSIGATVDGAAGRSIIVRWPLIDGEDVRKGVIVLTFTKTFSYFLLNVNLPLFKKYFHIVLEPSWSGYADADIFGFHGRMDNVLVQCSEILDRVLIGGFPETFVPVTFGASDWVDYDLFKPSENIIKEFDSVYVANATLGKRALRYLECVKEIVQGGFVEYKACLVCASWGGATEEIVNLAKELKLENNLTIKCALPSIEVVECINRSKVNVLLSYKEGSNRSLFESMFCNVPVICIGENVGVNKYYINEQTGLLISEDQLASSLIWMMHSFKRFSPRRWALANIAPEVTTQKMANVIAGVDGQGGDVGDYLVKVNNPEVSYFRKKDIHHAGHVLKLLKLFEHNTFFESPVLESNINKIVEEFNLELTQAG